MNKFIKNIIEKINNKFSKTKNIKVDSTKFNPISDLRGVLLYTNSFYALEDDETITGNSMFKINFSDINDSYEKYMFLTNKLAKLGNRSIVTILWVDNVHISINEFIDKFTRLYTNSQYVIWPVNGEWKIVKTSDNLSSPIHFMDYDEFTKFNNSLNRI